MPNPATTPAPAGATLPATVSPPLDNPFYRLQQGTSLTALADA